MNNDLISREAAIAQIERRKSLLVVDKTVSVDAFIKFLKNRPAVDAEPIRHGRWVWNNDAIDWNIGAWVCGECGVRNENIHAAMPGNVKAFSTNPYIYAGTKFCPTCGAKIDEVQKNERTNHYL